MQAAAARKAAGTRDPERRGSWNSWYAEQMASQLPPPVVDTYVPPPPPPLPMGDDKFMRRASWNKEINASSVQAPPVVDSDPVRRSSWIKAYIADQIKAVHAC